MSVSILLTGANGFVGQGIVRQALLRPRPVLLTCVSRRQIGPVTQAGAVRTLPMPEFTADTDWSDALSGITSVIHCAARVHVMRESAASAQEALALFRRVNVDATLNLARQAAAAGVRQFIFVSSVKVNGEATLPGQPFTEESPARPEDGYGVSKQEAEAALQELGRQSGMAITIVRPPLVYGPGVRANFLSMMLWVRRGVPLPLGSIANRRSFVFLDNLVDLILFCVDNPKAYNQVFLVSDGRDLSTTELLRACAHALDVPARLWPVPAAWLTLLAAVAGKKSIADRLCQSLQVDIGKARRVLDWTPPYTVEQGLRAVASHLAASHLTETHAKTTH